MMNSRATSGSSPRSTRLSMSACTVAAWCDAEIKRAITQGMHKDGTKLKPPMGFGYYAKMTDGDIDAVVAFVRTLPAFG